VAAFVNDYFSIDDDYVNSFGIAVRVLKGRLVSYASRIEYNDISSHANFQQASIGEAQLSGWQRGHLADGLF
jgi:hypothetical protein